MFKAAGKVLLQKNTLKVDVEEKKSRADRGALFVVVSLLPVVGLVTLGLLFLPRMLRFVGMAVQPRHKAGVRTFWSR